MRVKTGKYEERVKFIIKSCGKNDPGKNYLRKNVSGKCPLESYSPVNFLPGKVPPGKLPQENCTPPPPSINFFSFNLLI